MQVRMSRRRALELTVAAAVGGAFLLFISLFFDWYSLSAPTQSGGRVTAGSQGISGWDAFEFTDALFVFVLVAAAWIGAQRLSGRTERGFGWLAGLSAAAVFTALVSNVPVLQILGMSDLLNSSLKGGAVVGVIGAILLGAAAVFDEFGTVIEPLPPPRPVPPEPPAAPDPPPSPAGEAPARPTRRRSTNPPRRSSGTTRRKPPPRRPKGDAE
jgi:membrane peptidoglycan carboxypeptidase